MSREEIIEQYFAEVTEKDKLPIFYDNFDEAIIGVTQRSNEIPVIAYDVDIGGGWLGPNTPMFIRNEF